MGIWIFHKEILSFAIGGKKETRGKDIEREERGGGSARGRERDARRGGLLVLRQRDSI